MGEGGQGFGDRLVKRVTATSPLCVGIDPSSALLSAWGLPDAPDGLAQLSLAAVDAAVDLAAAVKPQVAFFERHGSKGIAVLEEVIAAARERSLLVIADAKRGDIDSTMDAYGEAWLEETSPLCADAVTATSYLGIAALDVVFERAVANGRGVFVVVASSNPEGRVLQEARCATGRSVEEESLMELARRNAAETASGGRALGSLGAVVGATRAGTPLALDQLSGPFLVPGVGAQGATSEDVAALFAACPTGSVLVNASRSILKSGPSADALRRSVADLASTLRADLIEASAPRN